MTGRAGNSSTKYYEWGSREGGDVGKTEVGGGAVGGGGNVA